MATSCIHPLRTRLIQTSLFPPIPPSSSYLCLQSTRSMQLFRNTRTSLSGRSRRTRGIACGFLPVDPWAPSIDSQSIATQLFAFSLFPYLGFLYFITKSSSTPKLTLFGFYFLLAFVAATIPAGIYAKVNYGTSLSNVDWLHGGAESLLSLTNLFVVLGLTRALRERKDLNGSAQVIWFQDSERRNMELKILWIASFLFQQAGAIGQIYKTTCARAMLLFYLFHKLPVFIL